MLTPADKVQKRLFDIALSVVGICIAWGIMLVAWIIASFETRSNGLFMQKRIGEDGKPFLVFKIKTMKTIEGKKSTVTTSSDIRITKSGKFFRRWKIDELPQLFNVLLGTMSFVGPRPDVAGFADKLEGDDRIILDLLPGITGPASSKYKDEEALLAKQKDPERYNRDVIWLDKIEINKTYIEEWSFAKDLGYILKTIKG